MVEEALQGFEWVHYRGGIDLLLTDTLRAVTSDLDRLKLHRIC